MSFVAAFNRNRDFYQVALALDEYGLLEKLVTDIYYPEDDFRRLIPGIQRTAHRRNDALPSRQVLWSYPALFFQCLIPFLPRYRIQLLRAANKAIVRKALARASAGSSNLFLYSDNAEVAFSAPEAARMHKGLFMYHPEPQFIRDLLEKDFLAHPECRWSIERTTETAISKSEIAQRQLQWKYADFIACASTFTAHTLEANGCSKNKLTVIPYGIDFEKIRFEPAKKSTAKCRFLFVGQGVQRKGLHHLLKAWNKLKLPDAELILVAYVLDPGIATLVSDNVQVLPKQPQDKLQELYSSANVFVLPSLVEGFGLVLLEALAAGCFTISTSNTGLPDLKCPNSVASVIAPGSIDALCEVLLAAFEAWRNSRLEPTEIRLHAETLGWKVFRKRVADLARRALS